MEPIMEAVDRLRRVETRLARLCNHLGMDKGDAASVYFDDLGQVNIRAMDVPISVIVRFIRSSAPPPSSVEGAWPVFFRGRVVASVNVWREE